MFICLVEAILQSKDLQPKETKSDEHVWKNGIGLLTAMKFVKTEYSSDKIQLSAWIQTGVGNIGGKEMDLTGVVGAIPKRQLMKIIEEIKSAF